MSTLLVFFLQRTRGKESFVSRSTTLHPFAELQQDIYRTFLHQLATRTRVNLTTTKMAAGASRTTVLLLAAVVAVASFARPGAADLKPDYYAGTCPNVETIVRGVVQNKMQSTIRTIGSTIRLFFHDCFVQGCDGSVLIQSTPGNQAERDASDNLSLAFEGFETVRSAKAAVENACPDTVSCADVLALAAREAIALVHIKPALALSSNE
jgi:hypothetical protein